MDHGFAVQPLAIVGQLLDGVPDGVPEVEHRALATLLALVGRDHGRLQLTAGGDDAHQRLGLEAQHVGQRILEMAEERRVENAPYLMTSAMPASSSRPRQRAQHGDVGEHSSG